MNIQNVVSVPRWAETVTKLIRISFFAALGVSLFQTAQAQTPPPEQPIAKSATTDPHDFSGMWEPKTFGFMVHNAPLLPAAKAKIDEYAAKRNKGKIMQTAWTSCRPGAISAMVMPRETIMIMQAPKEMTLLFEMPPMARRIRMNGEHPKTIEPSYMGDSVGHWEGNTLVIDSVGFNGHMELDALALPASSELHTIEKLTKSADGNRIDMTITIIDPANYSKPFTITRTWLKSDKRHQLEYDCMENPREEDFENAFYVQDLYRPTCYRVEGKGMELSHMVCLKPDSGGQPKASR